VKFTKASAYKNMCMMYVTSIFASLKYLPSLENQKKITTKKKKTKKNCFYFVSINLKKIVLRRVSTS